MIYKQHNLHFIDQDLYLYIQKRIILLEAKDTICS